MNTDIIDTSIPVKKKRGRPKKFALYRDFSEIIKNTFNNYLEQYKNIIDIILSYNNKDNRISQDDWNIIYNHVKYINDIIKDDVFSNLNEEYHYKPNSQWKIIDQIRENDMIKYINNFYNNQFIEDIVYKSFMIYSHIKLYISESSKEMMKI